MGVRGIKIRCRLVVEKDEDRFYAYAPALKGIHVGGDTSEEALENAKIAVQAYISSLLKHDEPIPISVMESERVFSRSAVKVLLQRIFCGNRIQSRVEEVTIAA